MCFTFEQNYKHKPLPQIAEEDIICWKRLKFNGKPAHYLLIIKGKSEAYRKGYIYTNRIVLKKSIFDGHYTGQNGFHSFIYFQENNHQTGKIVKFIIPKGAKYYANNNCYLSNKIQRA